MTKGFLSNEDKHIRTASASNAFKILNYHRVPKIFFKTYKVKCEIMKEK